MQTKRKIAIAICYYLQAEKYINNDECFPLQLGYDETGLDLGIQKDNEGKQRSDKHFLYSEYSGIYWLWKNVNAEYKGMLHHRRFLTKENHGIYFKIKKTVWHIIYRIKSIVTPHAYTYRSIIECGSSLQYYKLANSFSSQIESIFNDGYDMIVPKPIFYYPHSIKNRFDEVIHRSFLISVKKTIQEKHPEYISSFNETLNGNILYYANLEIMRNELFEEYCDFIFTIFDGVEKDLVESKAFLDLSKELSFYRSFGYLGEILTSTFITKKKKENKKIKECTVLFNKDCKGNENTNYSIMNL